MNAYITTKSIKFILYYLIYRYIPRKIRKLKSEKLNLKILSF